LGSKSKGLYSSNSKSKGKILVTDAKSKSGKGKGAKAGKKGKGSKGKSVLLVNLADPAGGCPKGSQIQLCHTVTNTCVQTVEVSGNACSCSLSIPSDDSKDHYCIKVNAPNYTCNGGIGSSCVQNLDITDQTEFCVQLQPVTEGSSQAISGSSNSSSSSTITYHQTQVIVVTTSDQTCKSDAIVKVFDCGSQAVSATFTTTSDNCANSFTLPASKTDFCMNVIAANYTCTGTSDCSFGPIKVPVESANVTTYEVIMQSVLGAVELYLNMSGTVQQEISSSSVTYSLMNQNGVVEATKVSDITGVTFTDLPAGYYSIGYQAISGYTCGGTLVEGNRCQTESVSCTSGTKTTVVYNIDKITPKPTIQPTIPPAAPIPMVPPIPETSKPQYTPTTAPVKQSVNATCIITVENSGTPSFGNQVELIVGETNQTIEICITSAQGKCLFQPTNTDFTYIVKVTPSEGTACEGSCSVKVNLKPGGSSEYTVALVPLKSTAVINVVEGGKPVPGTQVEITLTGKPNDVVSTCTTSADGKCKFSPDRNEISYSATIIPVSGTSCQDSCTVEMTLKPGETPEYTVVLVSIENTAVVTVIMENKPVPGVQVSYFITGTPDKIIGTNTTTTEGHSSFASESTEMKYTATVTPPEGTTCQESCSIAITFKTGEITEYTIILVPIKISVIVNVIKDNKPVPGVQVEYFAKGTTNQIIASETTTTEGKTTLSTEGPETSLTAQVTPLEGMSCQESCSVNMTLTPGKILEYTVVLIDAAATLVIKVEYEGESVPGAEVNFSMQNSPGKVLEACTISNLTKECELTIMNDYDTQYLSTVVPPAGFSCPEKGCIASFTLVPGKTLDYLFVLIKDPVPFGEAVVSVLHSGECVEGAQVEIFDSVNPTTILQSFTTTSVSCNVTFTTTNINAAYQATVTPPSSSYLCSGDFNSACSATFKVVVVKVTIVQCILVIITPPPITASPTKKPVVPPTPKPTMKPTKKPIVPPTPKPTLKPTEKPVVPPTPKPTLKPTKKPVVPPTPKPTKKPTEKPVVPPTTKPTKKPTEKPVIPPTPKPTKKPTEKPVVPPTPKPTKKPTEKPVVPPTPKPTKKPTEKPVVPPTPKPTKKPTEKPVVPPTPKPTKKPTEKPVVPPTLKPTMKPTEKPAFPPTPKPTKKPTEKPVLPPTPKPTKKPITASPTQKVKYESALVPPTPKPVKRPTKKVYVDISNDSSGAKIDSTVSGV
jgi:hypothetical protein